MKNKKQWIFLAVIAVLIAGIIAFMAGSTAKNGAENSSTVKNEQNVLREGLEDGEYQAEVELLGGSGKAKIASPAKLTVKNGEMTAELVWSSSNYTYMKIGDVTYYPVSTGGNSTFIVPVETFDEEIPFAAETVAMSTPHEIEYSLIIHEIGSGEGETAGEAAGEGSGGENADDAESGNVHIEGLTYTHSMELSYAAGFAVDYYEGGFALISISDGSHFLIVPEKSEVPENLKITDAGTGKEAAVAILKQPVSDIYLAATSAMNLFDAMDAIGAITMTGTEADGWYIENAKKAVENGDIIYAGKYSEPDYEMILSEGCSLAVESTMISHAPEVKEKLEEIGVPVLVDWSSYETHPLGRSEWIKLYGVLLGKEELAEQLFAEQEAYLKTVESSEKTGKTAAFFYVNTNGSVVTRKSGDYIARMIELAGGTYLFGGDASLDEGTSTLTLEMETFYITVKDADFIIYNSSMLGELNSIEELVALNPLLADCKAVQNGNVWCTRKNLYQETLHLGTMIDNLHTVFTDAENKVTELEFLYKLQ